MARQNTDAGNAGEQPAATGAEATAGGSAVGTTAFTASEENVVFQSAGGPEETFHAEIVTPEEAARRAEQAWVDYGNDPSRHDESAKG